MDHEFAWLGYVCDACGGACLHSSIQGDQIKSILRKIAITSKILIVGS